MGHFIHTSPQVPQTYKVSILLSAFFQGFKRYCNCLTAFTATGQTPKPTTTLSAQKNKK